MKVVKVEHGTVMSSAGASRIPAAAGSVEALGIRYQHYGWPGISRTTVGDILVSASERITHVDPFGRVVVCRSTDGGHSWDEPQVVFDSATDDRDAALCTLPDGTVVASWFSSRSWARDHYLKPEWEELKESVTPSTLRALSRGWLRRSHDGGSTWEDEVYPTIVGQHAGPTALANGDLIYCGPAAGPEGRRLVATRSTDGGLTWSVVGEIACARQVDEKTGDVHLAFNESHALEIAPDRILCAFRTNTENRNVHLARTEDGGQTWSGPEDIGVYGFPSFQVRLAAGPILCLFGDRRGPWAVRGVLSYDDGDTWDVGTVLTFWESPNRMDMGYPGAIEVSPGEVLCVFYSVPVPGTTPDYETLDPRQTGILSARMWLA